MLNWMIKRLTVRKLSINKNIKMLNKTLLVKKWQHLKLFKIKQLKTISLSITKKKCQSDKAKLHLKSSFMMQVHSLLNSH